MGSIKWEKELELESWLWSVGEGMLLTWDRGLHSFKMVKAALDQKCHILGRIPANVKFEVVQELADDSYLCRTCS